MNDLNQLNIDNLTSLWRKMGVNNTFENTTSELNSSRSWPHRHWFDWSTPANQIVAINKLLPHLPARAIIPIWMGVGEPAEQLERDLLAADFRISFHQLAMYLDLQTQQAYAEPALDISKVQTSDDIETWTTIASTAFGYWIDVEVIKSIAADPDITLLLAKRDGKAAATALVFKTGDIIGAHMVGVAADYRGQGIARMVMHSVINVSLALGGKYLTLQASVAGEALYRGLGFTAQFAIRNYHRPAKPLSK